MSVFDNGNIYNYDYTQMREVSNIISQKIFLGV